MLTWALGNLILSIMSMLLTFTALIIIIVFLALGHKRPSIVYPLITLVFGIIGVLFFLLGSDMTLSMVIIDSWTILHLALFVVQLILIIMTIVRYIKHPYPQRMNIRTANKICYTLLLPVVLCILFFIYYNGYVYDYTTAQRDVVNGIIVIIVIALIVLSNVIRVMYRRCPYCRFSFRYRMLISKNCPVCKKAL